MIISETFAATNFMSRNYLRFESGVSVVGPVIQATVREEFEDGFLEAGKYWKVLF